MFISGNKLIDGVGVCISFNGDARRVFAEV